VKNLLEAIVNFYRIKSRKIEKFAWPKLVSMGSITQWYVLMCLNTEKRNPKPGQIWSKSDFV